MAKGMTRKESVQNHSGENLALEGCLRSQGTSMGNHRAGGKEMERSYEKSDREGISHARGPRW